MRYLLDTNVISEMMRPRPDAGVVNWLGSSEATFVSVLTLGEIAIGIERLSLCDERRAASLQRWLDDLAAGFRDRTIGVDLAVALRWAKVNSPTPVPAVDGLIAATALEHGMTVVTRNVRDFERAGATVLNPFA